MGAFGNSGEQARGSMQVRVAPTCSRAQAARQRSAVPAGDVSKFFPGPNRAVPAERNLLFLHDVLLDGSQRGVVALLEPAGGQVPLVLLFQADVLLAEVRHLVLELIDPDPLLLQKPLLGLYDLVQLLQILRRLAGVLRRVLHLVKSPLAVHGGDIIPHKRSGAEQSGGEEAEEEKEERRWRWWLW